MVAVRGSTFTIFVKTLTGNTITLDVEKSAAVDNIKSKTQGKESTLADQQRLTFSGKQPEDERLISDNNVTHGSTLYTSGKLKGEAAMSAEEKTNALNMMSAQLQQVPTAVATEQVTTDDFRQKMNRGRDSGIIGAIRREAR